jgi:cob(I)alamin adenosyltransferase
MWYGSVVSRHGNDRPCTRYQPSSFARKRRRAAGDGSDGGDWRGWGARAADDGIGKIGPGIIGSVTLYTRTGDGGETSLFDGTRVSKSDLRVEAYGHVDELNATLGQVRALGLDPSLDGWVDRIQQDLFAVGAQLADPRARIAARVTRARLTEADVTRLEQWIDAADAELPPLRRFIVPGGGPVGAALHLARTVCRRAERHIVGLGPDAVDALVIAYVNRLSDLLFVLARLANARAGVADREWE